MHQLIVFILRVIGLALIMFGLLNVLGAAYLAYYRRVAGFGQMLVDSFDWLIGSNNYWMFIFFGVVTSLVVGCSQIVAGISLFAMRKWADIAISAMALVGLITGLIKVVFGGPNNFGT